MLNSLKLTGVGPAPSLDMELGPRLNIITGDNGLGKTFLLDVAWWCLIGQWPEGPALPSVLFEPRAAIADANISFVVSSGRDDLTSVRGSYSPFHSSWATDEDGRAPLPGLVVYACIDGGFSVWDPARHSYDDARLPAFKFFKDEVWRGKKAFTDQMICKGLLADWLYWQDREEKVFSNFCSVLKALSPPNEEICPAEKAVRLPGGDVSDIPALQTRHGIIPVTLASAAVRRILALAYLLVWARHEHEVASALLGIAPDPRMVVLIDEIEAHLHPRWQRAILPALIGVVDGLSDDGCVQIIVSTHAPMVLASAETVFNEESDRLFLLEMTDEGTVSLENLPWAPHGDASSWLTSRVFGLAEARSAEAENALKAANAFLNGEVADLPKGMKTRAQIDKALHRTLPENDPFWFLWRKLPALLKAAKKAAP